MTNQQQVRDVYLKVIEATVESVRAEFLERSIGEDALEGLDILKARWQARLTQTHDFTEDPQLIDRSSATNRAGKKQGGKAAKKKASAPITEESSASTTARNGGIPVAALTNDTDEVANPLPGPHMASHGAKLENIIDTDAHDAGVEQPPSKRPRVVGSHPIASDSNGRAVDEADDEDDDGRVDNVGEDLDSSDDSDVQGGDSDEEAENLILAQHEKVRKGQKWKVHLREGIISIRGREYLFHKATCDLDF